ncbi:MAG: FG-GAP repeat protein [Ignavibacteria bacterium]|nr:FG-GAP repeat protein [Ignavibacteria bacterium]
MRHTHVSTSAFIACAVDALFRPPLRQLMHAINLHPGGAHACGRAAGLRILSALLLCTPVVTAQNASPDMEFPEANILFSSIGHGWARYGDSMVSLGDVNRDGIPDIFINAYMTLPWAYLVFGTRPGILDRVSYMRLEGYGTLAKGDVNGDGLPDLLSQSNGTTITMYPGCATCPLTIDTVFAWRLHPDSSIGDTDFGRSIAVGDLNGDGRDDIAVADPDWFLWSRPGAGKIFIYFGGSAKFPSADMTATIQEYRHIYGENGLAVADVTGDGYKDLVIGTEDRSGPRYSYIDVYFGGPGFTCDPSKPSQRFGKEVIPYWSGEFSLHARNLLDMNHDGIKDLYVAVGRHGYIYHGGPGGIHTTPDRVLAVPDSLNYYFFPNAFDIGDINGDTFDDFLLSAHTMFTPAFAFIYLGSPSGMESYPAATAWAPNGGDVLARMATGLGDMDGDGLRDFAASYFDWGSPGFALYAGKAWERVRVPVEEVPHAYSAGLTAYPNPFNDLTTILVVGHRQESGLVTVYDVHGRSIRKLPLLGQTGEEHRVIWDGRDASGAPAAAGMYYCLLETNSGLLTARVMKR